MKISLTALFLGLFILSGCATIVSGSDQSVTIQSSPDGADILMNGVTMGKTPITMSIQRDSYTMLTIEKEGYKSETQLMNTELNSMFWGNILFGGLLGSTTDAASGASREYAPGVVFVKLEKLEKPEEL